MIDVLICSVPSGIINRPPAAPALLKACVVHAGFSAKTLDLSLVLFNDFCHRDYQKYYRINNEFESLSIWTNADIIHNWLKKSVNLIALANARYLAISVFSYAQHRATVLLCEAVREQLPQVKIILGGYGITEPCVNSFANFRSISSAYTLQGFDHWIRQHNLADHVVIGEGEQQLVDILHNQPTCLQPVNLEQIPFSNFDDYHLDQYLWHNEPVLLITGSKGCVRQCTFCNVPRRFGRYRKKTGKRIAEEIIALSQQYAVYKFEFTDSLVNGSMSEFEEFVTVLADYNSQAKIPISWYGQYICRPQSQIKKHIYSLIKQSGAVNLIIGAESGSDAVLAAMNKRQNVKDLFDELDQFEAHGLQAQLLVMVSFINETWPRFLETLTFIAKCHRYLAAGVITKIAAGLPLIIEPNGFLHVHADQLGIVLDPANTSAWTVRNDPDNTWLERLRRRLILQNLLDLMQVSMTGNGINELKSMAQQLEVYEQSLRSPSSIGNTAVLAVGAH